MRKPAPRPKAHTTKKAHDTTGAGKKMKPGDKASPIYPDDPQKGRKR